MPSREPPRRPLPVVHQEWRDVSFLHWPFDPGALAHLVPPTLALDTFDGAAWISITPFSTTCAVAEWITLPGPRRFPETNVRTYVHGPDGRDGIWFLSLNVTNRANVALGRALALPYYRCQMTIERVSDRTLRYRGARQSAEYDITVRETDEPADDDLDLFLTGRWSAYVRWFGPLVRYDARHQRWPLRRATLIGAQQSLLAAFCLPRPTTDPVVHFASGVSAHIGLPHLVARPARTPGAAIDGIV